MNKIIRTIFFRPASVIWESAYRIRRSMYEYGVLRKEYFKVPILSIGNITFGGTGKTPMTVWLIEKLENYVIDAGIVTT